MRQKTLQSRYMKTLMTFLILCLLCTSAFAGRDDYIIYHSGSSYIQTVKNLHVMRMDIFVQEILRKLFILTVTTMVTMEGLA